MISGTENKIKGSYITGTKLIVAYKLSHSLTGSLQNKHLLFCHSTEDHILQFCKPGVLHALDIDGCAYAGMSFSDVLFQSYFQSSILDPRAHRIVLFFPETPLGS